MPRFIRHISDSALQFLVNQAFGLGLFFVLSKGLDKEQFGELNWTLAVFLTAFGVLGAGLDQLTVRKIAAGDPPERVLALYRTHVWVSGLLFYAALLGARFLFPVFFVRHALLLWLGLAKTGLFFSMPYKQLAAGREKFAVLLRMSVSSSVIKGGALLACFLLHCLTMPVVLAMFIAGDLAEWGICVYLGSHIPGGKTPRAWDRRAWAALLRESLPQVGVVLFSAAMARFDWIFIGLYSPAARLAEYSFAYKAFEVSSLPLLIVAPLLVPAFTRLVGEGRLGSRMGDLLRLVRGEQLLACGTVLLLNIAWSPLVDAFTNGKYGVVNARTVFLLSGCLPLMYLNNLLWTLHFAKGRLRMIFWVFAGSFALNAAGDIVLIPLFGNEGAALAYLLSLGMQTVLYLLKTTDTPLRRSWMTLLMASIAAAFSGCLACRYWTGVPARLAGASLLYILVLVLTRQIRREDYRFLLEGRQPFKRRPRME